VRGRQVRRPFGRHCWHLFLPVLTHCARLRRFAAPNVVVLLLAAGQQLRNAHMALPDAPYVLESRDGFRRHCLTFRVSALVLNFVAHLSYTGNRCCFPIDAVHFSVVNLHVLFVFVFLAGEFLDVHLPGNFCRGLLCISFFVQSSGVEGHALCAFFSPQHCSALLLPREVLCC